MRNKVIVKKLFSVLLVLAIVLTLVPMNIITVNAASTSNLTFQLNSDGKSYKITDCKTSASGRLTIPETYNEKPVISIGDYVFSGCTKLTSITIPDSVTSIGSGAFKNCTGLTSITIPDSVVSIGSEAFYDCSFLQKMTIPFIGAKLDSSNNTHLGYIFGASEYCFNLNYVPSSLKEIVITKATSIGSGAFYNCLGLTSITIPDTVMSIGYRAFMNCTGLTSVTIPDSVTSIGKEAFRSCTGFTSIIIPDSVVSIGSDAFFGCSSLEKITLPFIGAELDRTYNTHLGYIFGATSESYNSNYVPSSLKEVVITKATSIGDYAFYYCTGLTSVTIPNSVTSIGRMAFYCCTALASIVIPDSVTTIGYCAFYGCESFENITVPNSVTNFGEGAFVNCVGLKSITLPNNITILPCGVLNACKNLTNITIPDSITSIGDYAFKYCTALTSITIPDKVTNISDTAFYECTNLTSIVIPNSLISIGEEAFRYCTGLTDVWYIGSVENKSEIDISENNDCLINATWHYNTCAGEHSYINCYASLCSSCEWERNDQEIPTSADLLEMQQSVLGVTEQAIDKLDMNADKMVDSTDLVVLQMMILKMF